MKYLVGLLLGGLMEDPEPRFGNPYLIVEAAKIQDDFGNWIVKTLSKKKE